MRSKFRRQLSLERELIREKNDTSRSNEFSEQDDILYVNSK